MVALDRQERGHGENSAMQEVKAEFAIDTASIISLANLMTFLNAQEDKAEELARMQRYLKEYGCS